jgi:hypothetical protein
VREQLNENLREELILTIIETIYKGDKTKRKFLESLSEEDLDQMLGDYYRYDIKND